MKKPPDPPSPCRDAQVISLPDVIPPVRRVLRFYDELIAGTQPSITQLDDAVSELKTLPDIPGRLGRDIARIADGGRGSTRQEIIGSLERLRQIASMNPDAPAAARQTRPSPARRRPTRTTAVPQESLPFGTA